MVIIALIAALILIGVDQAIKLWAVNTLTAVDTIPLIQDVLHLTYVENRGAAFSMLQGQTWFLVGITAVVAIAAIAVLLSGRVKDKMAIWSIALIIAGGVGNLIDRIGRGFVVDYIDFRLIHFPVFNFADCCVVVGTILLAFYILFWEEKKHKKTIHESGDGNANESAV